MIRRILNLVSKSRSNLVPVKNMNVIEPLEGRLFMSVAPAAVAPPGTIAADRAAIKAELALIKTHQMTVKTEIAAARHEFRTVTQPADEAAIKAAEKTLRFDKTHDSKLSTYKSILAADKAVITTDKMQLKTDHASLFSTIKLDMANGKTTHMADETTLKALRAKLKADL